MMDSSNSPFIHYEHGLPPMMDSSNSPFIHYEHGLPPVFNKTMFQYTAPDFVSFGDPFEVLAENSPTESAHFISELAKRSLAAR
jgi:hypothetical protein